MAPAEPSPTMETYHEKPTLNNAMSGAVQAGTIGLVVSAVQNSMGKHKHGALGIFTRTGGTIGLFTAVGAAFGLTESFVSNSRQKEDSINGAAAACASGLVVGASARSVPLMAGSCAGLAVLVGTFDAAGRSLSGSYPRASPFFGVSRIDGEADKHSHTTGGPGELGWREERERRRNAFFKQKKQPADVQTE